MCESRDSILTMEMSHAMSDSYSSCRMLICCHICYVCSCIFAVPADTGSTE